MTEASFPSRTRFIVLAVSAALAVLIFYGISPQITSLDPEISAVQESQKQLRKKNYQEAAQILSAAANKYPRNGDIRYNLGLAYAGMNQPQLAVDQFIVALNNDPYLPGAAFEMGRHYLQYNQMNSAQEMLRRLQTSCARGVGCAERDGLAAAITKTRAMQEITGQNR